MNVMDALKTLQTQGVGLLEAVRGMSTEQLAGLGLRLSTAGSWRRLSETFFGPTRQRKLQRAAVAAAREGKLPVEALTIVDKHARKLLAGDEWALRAELCALRGTVDEIDRAAAARVRELNRELRDAEKKSFGRRALKGGKNTDPAGLRTITVTLPERIMAQTLATLRATAGALRAKAPRLGYEQAMADAFLAHIDGRAAGRRSETLTPLVVIGLPDWARLLRHEGDESVFALTDGTTMTGAELAQASMAEHHLVGIYDPVAGPVNLYRSDRHANLKQRLLLSAETILCPVPGCTTSADECQVHHIDAWKLGGETNLSGMTMACPVHNGRNDDDPNAPPRHGRLERLDGVVVFRPPDGSSPTADRDPMTTMSARALSSGSPAPDPAP